MLYRRVIVNEHSQAHGEMLLCMCFGRSVTGEASAISFYTVRRLARPLKRVRGALIGLVFLAPESALFNLYA